MAEADARYRIIFAREFEMAPSEPGTIVIVPNPRVRSRAAQIDADFTIHPRKETGIEFGRLGFQGYVGFVDGRPHKSTSQTLPQIFNVRNETALEPTQIESFFFTMLPAIGAYRELVNQAGPAEARLILLSLHDMVEGGGAPARRNWYRFARESLLFQGTFLRTSEAYFAWKNAGTLLDGTQFEEIGRLSETLFIDYQLAGRPNAHSLKFQFSLHEPVLPKRFSVLIGKNGVGKSQALGRIAEAALKGDSALRDGNGERPLFSRVLAFYPTVLASAAFPVERRRGARIWYRRFALNGAGIGPRRQTTPDIIVELARTREAIKDRGRLEIFAASLAAIEGHREIALRTRDTPARYLSLCELLEMDGRAAREQFALVDLKQEPLRLVNDHAYPLSSGELSFLRFAALASLHVENSSLLLFDEPETHLHPNFISQFVALLDTLLAQTGSAAIIATHSAYFVREAFEDQVIVLRSCEDRQIVAEVPRLKTFGADIGTISYFVFGEDEPSTLAKRLEGEIAGRHDDWAEVFERYKDQLSMDVLGDLRARIEGGS